MRLKFYVVLFGCLISGALLSSYAQNRVLNIKTVTNENKSISLASLSKITFSDDGMFLNYKTGTDEKIAMGSVEKMFFSLSSSSIGGESVVESTLSVYPNPVVNVLTLDNLPNTLSRIKIYSITGTCVLNTELSASENTLDVSKLQVGLYILKVNNQVLKFTKK